MTAQRRDRSLALGVKGVLAVLRVVDVSVEHRVNPLGLDVPRPRIGWRLLSDRRGVTQAAYRIQVSTETDPAWWDSGRVVSAASQHIGYDGPPLMPHTRYQLRVEAWDDAGEASGPGEGAFFETGMGGPEGWSGSWITTDADETPAPGRPSPLIRRTFQLDGQVAGAKLYATALGVYSLSLNGRPVTEDLFAPGWTRYQDRVQYQTYDVTELLRSGENAWGAMLGNGWYAGDLGFRPDRVGSRGARALLAELHVRFSDGRHVVVTTDGAWRFRWGPIESSEIYHGERYDARKECPGWDGPDFDDAAWEPVRLLPYGYDNLVAQENEPTRITREVAPLRRITTPGGDTVIDFGQNLTGWVRFQVTAPAGHEVRLEHAEILDHDGNFYVANLRGARQTVSYICRGQGTETYAPHFTWQGFRYVRLTGFPEDLDLSHLMAQVIHTDLKETIHFDSLHPLLNRLQENIMWSQRGNFLDIPTDCPQRDERLGWTGDAQVFIATACYQMQVLPFFTKWLRDLKAEQLPNGSVPHVIPDALSQVDPDHSHHGSTAWADAAVICPWRLYVHYGDRDLLAAQYDSMRAWVEHMRSRGPDPVRFRGGHHFGDWLGLDAPEGSYVGATSIDLICQAFCAYSTDIVARAAQALGRDADAHAYRVWREVVVDAFREDFIGPDGDLTEPTQTAYVLALHFGLVPEVGRALLAERLHESLRGRDWHLATGFVGTPYLLHALTAVGDGETAYRLLLQTSMPSWLYPVLNGATTIWEHWDGIKEDGSLWSANMNSFNHYAYGAVGEWLYHTAAGIQPDTDRPGFQHIRIAPTPSRQLGRLQVTYDSLYGPIRVHWEYRGDRFFLTATLPPNTRGTLVMPHRDTPDLEADWEASSSGETEAGHAIMPVGSGTYRLSYRA